MRYAGVALVAAVVGFGGATLVKNGGNKAQVDRSPDITFSDVYINPTFGGVSIYWTTNVPTNGRIEYGPTDLYGQQNNVDDMVMPPRYHRFVLSRSWASLPDTAHFRIVAIDPQTKKETKSGDYVVNFYNIATGECKTLARVPEDYQHIQAAMHAACPNGTVMVSPGTYHEEILIGDGIDLIGAGPSNTKIISPAAAGPTITMGMNRYADNLVKRSSTVSGFMISSDYLAIQPPSPVFEPVFQAGPTDAASDNPYKTSGTGSIGLAFVRNATVKNNIFSRNNIDMLIIESASGTIENNTFAGGERNNFGILVWLNDSAGSAPSLVIQNNAIVNHNVAGIRAACEIYLIDICKTQWIGKGFLRYNNFWHNRNDYLFETAYHVGKSAHSPPSIVSPYPFFNPIWQFRDFLMGKEANQTGKNGNISMDPLFVNENAGDFHERVGSPHVDAGNPQSDFSLEPQPNGGRINIGAYGNTAEAAQSR